MIKQIDTKARPGRLVIENCHWNPGAQHQGEIKEEKNEDSCVKLCVLGKQKDKFLLFEKFHVDWCVS
jgi:hypothetical protein